MNSPRQFLSRLLRFFRPGNFEAEMTEEMRQHLEHRIQDKIADGIAPEEARRAARREFGGIMQVQEQCRDEHGLPQLEMIAQDARFAARTLRRNPGFTAVVVLTLALSLGACLTIFSVVDSLLLHPLDNPAPDRLVTLRSKSANTPDLPVSPADFLDWQKGTHSFTSFAARGEGTRTLTEQGEPTRMRAIFVTANFFDVLGVGPVLGRAFLPEETGSHAGHVVLVSYALWQSTFGGRADVLGRTIRLNEEGYTIVGVLPANFDRVGGLIGWDDIALPAAFSGDWLSHREGRNGGLTVQARLKPGVSVAQAQAEMDLFCAELARQYPDTNKGIGASVVPTGELMTLTIRSALWSLCGAVAGVLLIACANIASLLLVRATVRHREISLRTAFGATRSRLLRLLLTESLGLSLLGGGLGVLLAFGGIRLIGSLRFHSSVGLTQLALVKLDPRMLGIALVLSVGTGLLFGLAPAWLASRGELSDALKSGTRGATEAGGRGRLRSALVVFEIAAALVLLVCAGLLAHSFIRLAHFDPGFDPTHIAYANVSLQGPRYRADTAAEVDQRVITFTDTVLDRLRALPGVEAVGVTITMPAITVGDARTGLTFSIAGRPELPVNERPGIQWNVASPGYFDAMGMRLRRGRLFTDRDNQRSRRVAVVSETVARLFFPGEDPIGQRIRVDNGRFTDWSEIVGVVADTVFSYGQDRRPLVYEPFAQVPNTYLHFAVRTAGNPAAIVPMLKPQINAVDTDLAVPWAATLTQTIGELSTLARQHFVVQLLAVFSGLALVIAMVGIYGVISYSVSRRTTEIGIRMALGATVFDAMRLVLGQGARLVGIGLLLGFVGSVAAGHAMKTMLYQTSTVDPATFIAVGSLLAATALLACWVPARRAMKVDPMVALRAE